MAEREFIAAIDHRKLFTQIKKKKKTKTTTNFNRMQITQHDVLNKQTLLLNIYVCMRFVSN